MKCLINLALLSAIAFPLTLSSAVPSKDLPSVALADIEVLPRALPNAPDGYTPKSGDCPSTRPSVRSAAQLSQNETSWLESRRNNTLQPMKDLLTRMNITGFDANSYINSHQNNVSALPNIGIAMSGGGWRALNNGAGALAAFDSRVENTTNSGQLGGLLQSATYLTGLSGGGWLVGSIFQNNFSTVPALRDNPSGSLWEFGNSVLEGPEKGGLQILNTAEYYTNLQKDVGGKSDAGYQTTLTDYWGRALSFQLINDTDGGVSYTWSSIAQTPSFQDANTPMPIIIADERAPGEVLIPGNTTVYEFNPFEFGSWDPTTFGFIPMEFLGSNFSAGVLPDGEQCVRGYDNAGFVMGTSSTLFNQILFSVNSSGLPQALQNGINDILADVGVTNNDIADYQPNPFYGYNNNTNSNANVTALTLVDGGEDNENIPLHPLIQPNRHVDVIFAVDSSADTTLNWPNGSALVNTYQRQLNSSGVGNHTAFPSIPDTSTFINLGLNSRPTFFGCNASNITGQAPLIVYVPNAPYVTFSNVSTLTLTYNDSYRDALIENGYDAATQANGTVDSTWPMCVGCAILSRSFDRTGVTVPDACQTCFSKYCWDGSLNASTPASYEPSILRADTSAQRSSGKKYYPSAAAVLALAAILTAALV